MTSASGRLEGRTVVITGSTRGLGRAFAQEVGRQGAGVVINGRDAEAGAALLETLSNDGIDAVFVEGSVGEADVAERLISTAVGRFGAVDLVVNNAGIIRDRTLGRMSDEDFDDVVQTHLRGTWLTCRAAARAMRGRGGAVLNIVSGSALYGLVGQSNYAAAKGGIIALTRALSVELAGAGVRVNALYPAALTDMTKTVVEASGDRAAGIPEFEPPERVAPIVTYLASPAADAVTGQVLSFDGRTVTVWSHPAPVHTLTRDSPWTADDVERAFSEGDLSIEPLHPDALGQAVRDALLPRERSPR